MAIYNYLRVSTDDQDCARQRAFFSEKGGEIVEEKRSGKDLVNRPVLRQLIANLQAGDIVRAASVDRIARSVIDAHEIVRQILAKGATLEITGQNMVFVPDAESNPIQKVTFTILAAFAEFERAVVRERQAQGYAAIRSGVHKSKGRKQFHTQKTIRAVLDDVLQNGLSIRKAAEKHGLPAATVQYMVKKVKSARV
ncbi:MAG: recombinase family protein [Puniceicoccales bacterium]|jgi:DNA invertase Pin-like site-specific DNA recombinase|nr:recombinase family protein [Puniceicoccales bacterium]